MRDSERALRGLRWGAWGVCALAIVWGLALGIRPVLAYGLAHLAVMLLLRRYPAASLGRVRITRAMPPAAVEDERVPVRFQVVNAGRLRLFFPRIEDRFAPDRVARRFASLFPALPARHRRSAQYQGRCFSKRGLYTIGPVELHATCPLGLFHAQRSLALTARLVVYPTVEPLSVQPARGASLSPLFGGRSTRQAGEGDLPFGVRDYRPGDPLRGVHWPTSARRGQLAILERERHVAQRLIIAFDLSRESLRGLGRQSTLEVSIRLVAAVSARAIDDGYRVGLVTSDESFLGLGPAGGRAQLTRILDALAVVRPQGETPLSRVVEHAAPDLGPGEGVLLVVVDAEGDLEPLLEQVIRLRSRRCLVSAIVLDPAGFPRLHQTGGPPPSLDEVALRFLAEGVVVYALRPGESLAAALAHPYQGRARVRILAEDLA